MSYLLAFVLSFLTPEAEALRATAPEYLTLDAARVHVAAAKLASLVHRVDAPLLLAIAYYESRYEQRQETLEPLRKVSCGVMTPVPTHDRTLCAAHQSSLLAGYMAGAAHLRGWLDTPTCRGNLRCALLGYAGGYRLLRRCASGPVLQNRAGLVVDACKTPEVRQARAARISRPSARQRVS